MIENIETLTEIHCKIPDPKPSQLSRDGNDYVAVVNGQTLRAPTKAILDSMIRGDL